MDLRRIGLPVLVVGVAGVAACLVTTNEDLWKQDASADRTQRPDVTSDLTRRPDAFKVPDAGCPAGYSQCGPVCAQLTSDVNHCGACNSPCPATTDRCIDRKCLCGPAGDPCASTLNCVAGICKCTPGGLCNGCCDGSTCVQLGSSQSTTRCGKAGELCKSCETKDPCVASTSCVAGTCQSTTAPNGTKCTVGLYCVVDELCVSGKCLGNPRDCSSLNAACVAGTCNEAQQKCVATPVSDNTPCDLDGKYCTDDRCKAGVCTAGAARNCGAQGGPCTTGVCDEAAGKCVAQNKFDGTPCNDNNDCTDPDTCTAGTCGGPAKPAGTKCGFSGKCCGSVCCGNRNVDTCCGGTACCKPGSACCGSTCCSIMQQCCPGQVCKSFC